MLEGGIPCGIVAANASGELALRRQVALHPLHGRVTPRSLPDDADLVAVLFRDATIARLR
jgi:hypothetical protein